LGFSPGQTIKQKAQQQNNTTEIGPTSKDREIGLIA
jgi:hypothetical protein